MPAVTPWARSRPTPRPSTAEITPTTDASRSTEPSTWARLAPRARRRASSLVRCATRIEKVFEITKVPTSRAMAPKIVSASLRNLKLFWPFTESWRMAAARVMACAGGGQAGRDPGHQLLLGHPVVGLDVDALHLVLQADEALGLRQRERRGDRPAGALRRAEGERADDSGLHRGLLRDDGDRVAEPGGGRPPRRRR